MLDIHTSYLTAGTYKYEPYVAADFAAGGMENPNSPKPVPGKFDAMAVYQ